MATKLKKEDFDKYNTRGFKIGDKVLVPSLNNLKAEIIAIDLSRTEYNVMIDAIDIHPLSKGVSHSPMSLMIDYSMIYYRKKALKEKYEIWIRSDDIQHMRAEEKDKEEIDSAEPEGYIHGEEDDMEEDNDIEDTGEDEDDDSDTFMIENYLKDDSNTYLELDLSPKYNSSVFGYSCWDNETYTGKDSLIEVSYDDAKYMAIVFDSNNSSSNEELLGAILKSAERRSDVPTLNKIIFDSIASSNNGTTVEGLIEDIVYDAYLEDIVHSYSWNRKGMCAVLIKRYYE